LAALISQLVFAPDGHHLFYSKADQAKGDFRDLYKVPTLGGSSEKIIADVDSMISFGPGGREFTFRREYPDKQQSLLYIANADGTGERVIAERKRPDGFMSDPAWSPDGKTMASWVNEPVPDVQEVSLLAINVADGSLSPIGSNKWRWPMMVRWLPDGNELLLNGLGQAGDPRFQCEQRGSV
jgi:eukaryotic-like serine/threonine-protein kinase